MSQIGKTSSQDPDDAAMPEQLLDFLLDNIPDRMYFKDRKSRFLRVSRALANFLGLSGPAQLTGKTDFDVFTSEHAQPAFDDEQEILRTGRPLVGKVEKETLPDGRVGWALTTKMPLRNARGEIIGTCGISKDMTALKNLEEALQTSNEELSRHKSELERALAQLERTHAELKIARQLLTEIETTQSADRIAYGVAHEIRNPLTVLSAGVDYLGQDDPDAATKEILKEMTEAIERADTVISALMDSSGPTNLQLEDTPVNEVVEVALAAVRAKLAPAFENIHVIKTLGENLPAARLDRNKVERIVAGVIQNAVEAMSGTGGPLFIRTALETMVDADVVRAPGTRSGEHLRHGDPIVTIEVHDSGPGIPPEDLPRVFDLFFTTKETDQGTGLGLTLCRSIMELHHGAIKLRNHPEGGVQITLMFSVAS